MIRSRAELLDAQARRHASTATELIIETGGRGQGAVRVRQFRLRVVDEDHLMCRTWDGTTEGDEDVAIARPWTLRKNGQRLTGLVYAFTGVQARTVTRTSDGQIENQVVTPPYQTGDVIYAVRVPGGTAVEVGGAAVVWQEVDGGRAYCEVTT